MKYLFLLLLTIVISGIAISQKLIVITFADTKDKDIGGCCTAMIKEVKYLFHPTFPRQTDIATDKKNDYRYVIFLWGEFLLKSEITLTDGTIIYLAKELKLP